MPGIIQVSALEFINLPLSSSTNIKVSVGKREYQISEKGDFSFPLTNLHDDLIVKLLDADGNEISCTGVQTKSIVEKGVWEDIFPLGGGHLHLKLQFILNEEERNRIRMMRQTALKKKHDELLSSSLRGAKSDATSVGNAASPICAKDEVSESQKKPLQLEAVSRVRSPVGFHNDKKSVTRNVFEGRPDQKQPNPNIADQYKEASSPDAVSNADDLTQLQHKILVKKPAIKSPSLKDSQRATGSEETAFPLRSSEPNNSAMNNLIQPNLEEDSVCYSEEQRPLRRAPSNVRKMITAYESGLAQDAEVDKAQNTKAAGSLQGRVKGASLAGELQQAPAYIAESREQIKLLSLVSSKDTRQLKELSTIKILNEQTDSKGKTKFKIAQNTDTEGEKDNKDLIRTSTSERVTLSGKISEKHSVGNHSCHLFSSKKNRSNPIKEEKIASKVSHELFIQGASPHDSFVHFDDKYYSFESSGAWLFPDEAGKFCITTVGNKIIGLLGSQVTMHLGHQGSLDFSILENVEKKKNAASDETGTEVCKHELSHEIEESKSKNSDDNGDKISGGPIKQAIKVAIIVGFGLLVLLTRQRKSR